MMRRLEMKAPPKCPVTRTVAIATAELLKESQASLDLEVGDEMPSVKKELMGRMFQSTIKERVARLEREVRLAGPTANGCGAKGSELSIPDRPFGINFKPACDAHDKRYTLLSWTRKKADDAFLRDLLDICDRSFPYRKSQFRDWLLHVRCTRTAVVYYNFVHLFGGQAYDAAQIQARENDWK